MYSIRNFISLALFLSVTPTLATDVSPNNDHEKETKYDLDAFQKLLNSVDPPALHAALHDFSPKKFIHGVFPEDRTAVEAIHKEEPGLATGIVKIAKLSKRQSNGTVTSSESSAEPSPTIPTPVPQDSTSTPPEESATGVESSTPSSTPATTSAPIISSESPSSSSMSDGSVVTTTNADGFVVVSTIGGGATTLTPSGSSSSSPTTTRPRSSMTSTIIQTSTLPDGGQSTITAVTVVGADAEGGETPTGEAGVGASGTETGQPGLQTGEAVMSRSCGKEMAVVLGAAVGMAFML